ncbi:amylo-alpha-1,6-glucosidase [Siccirubricoccus sp. KC 17139]|uniref:Amylo-alpha-1,6-glucosidase n=1 Tax=Siccirubricoccus soli TaxID=2899147 RepID=A0ABT1D314_9PROT|nr:amylo-alpha-1,6-glucosidase [Siccirubricoccus soli]MCO6415997.1 amylo-alpha-1,6-glucosidase [Siccirubricoccus soli]MCP2682129.1 amylo-alpha-1,6-glucosidase [Siccirubricoccus soli]
MTAPAVTEADPHAITADVSLHERQLRVLKHDDTFAVLDQSGDARPQPGAPQGLYHRDTRHLSRLELRIAGTTPLVLSSAVSDDGALLSCDLTNPDLDAAQGGPAIERDRVHIRRTKFIHRGTCYERIGIRSFADRPVRLALDIQFAADFADLFEVRGERRPRRGTLQAPGLAPDGVTLAYVGLDHRRRATRLRFHPAPDRLEAGQAHFALTLAPGERRSILVEVSCNPAPGLPPELPAAALLRALREGRRSRRTALARMAAATTSDAIFNEMLGRSVADLELLTTETPEGPYPYAGVPWFSTVFGRDALITAWLTLWLDPAIALGVLRRLAALQAGAEDAAADAEPGKILHEMRAGEMAELGEVPFRRYYGSVDSTPLFVALAGAWLDRTGEAEVLRPLWPHLEAALRWIETHGDRDGDGFIEYGRRTATGLANQGWKDSWDSISHEDGTLAEGPIALCEVQAYAYAAFRAGARIARALGLPAGRAAALEARAETLRERFEAAFWCDRLGTYVLALDGAKRPCRVRASNAGHALFGGIASPERAALVARQLLGGTFHSGWGIRTLATTEARYNPMSYHNGSVWPHDTALIGLGLARYGHRAATARLLEGLAAAAGRLELRRLPELFCGFPRRRGHGPTAYPVACAPQAWAAAAPIGLLGACLGLSFNPEARVVWLDRPEIPAGLDRVALRGLALGEARIDIDLRRVGDAVAMSVPGRQGEIGAALNA